MTHKTHTTPLTEFDMMVIRAGGKTQAELEAMAERGSAPGRGVIPTVARAEWSLA